ncbi:hypothetical protein KRR38_33710 [Novosphingobium sp. G106]|uniref:hypothetical protein n=1 Tax=Novosphingobium sp. G106 TaxID=2849500 RepID=UPI001C2DD25E|nr:hypothetical protein [Novosphingobium sp. G106]MBV1692193.1 hypothetical protein [Novosphingobium sp. G106]MBV1692462.1 hypothetical protein [Novosphingobium sp. G106]
MPSYKILPTEPSRSAEFKACDAAAVFQLVSRLECKEADVLADDAYAFSVRLGDNGLWTIFNRGGDFSRDDISAWGSGIHAL